MHFPDNKSNYKVLACQLGAREHYLVARCFAKSGNLSCLVTDFWRPAWLSKRWPTRYLPKFISSAIARHHPELESQRVVSFPILGVMRYVLALANKLEKNESRIAANFARLIKRLEINNNIFFGYSYDSLELLRQENAKGSFKILCQTDPGPAHYRMLEEEGSLWPEYALPGVPQPMEDRAERLKQEWDIADVIIVNSDWAKTSIVSEGAPISKIEVLPLAYVPELARASRHRNQGRRKLKVLWLGNVALGKGIHYLIEAAKLIIREPVEFVIGGSIHIPQAIIRGSPKNIKWLGQIPRNITSELYQDCDVFIFPTLSDGFGITQLEAMAHGLPVITTPNCGLVVKENVTGFVVPPRDAKLLSHAILRFVHNPGLSTQMSPNCQDAVKGFSVDVYNSRILSIIENRVAAILGKHGS